MNSDAQHDALLARIMAIEALLVATKITKPRELRLVKQRAANKIRRRQEQVEDWLRRQQG